MEDTKSFNIIQSVNSAFTSSKCHNQKIIVMKMEKEEEKDIVAKIGVEKDVNNNSSSSSSSSSSQDSTIYLVRGNDKIGGKISKSTTTSSSAAVVDDDVDVDNVHNEDVNNHLDVPSITTGSSQDQYDRTFKVAKKRYSDHGSHGVVLKSSLLKKMTTSLQDLYTNHYEKDDNNNDDNNDNHNDVVLNGDEEHRMDTADDNNSMNKNSICCDIDNVINCNSDIVTSSSPSMSTTPTTNTNIISKKRLTPHDEQNNSANSNDAISMKPTNSLLHHALQQQEQEKSVSDDRIRQCFTNPSKPHSNNGLDNDEGNLIVHKDDLIRVLNRNIRYHRKASSDNDARHDSSSSETSPTPATTTSPSPSSTNPSHVTTYKVLDMLGQGTFAQVFKCKNVDTGQLCAVKIVKNKPAYTRQAAVEIDIFVALSKESPKNNNSMGINLMESKEANKESDDDYLVSLLSYFMYQSHLCLVFELLGLNLYEVLKKRQFRGLPITVVRNLVKQAIRGTNVLSEKNIVHCDLKPENILVISDEDVDYMVQGKTNINNNMVYDNKTCDYDSDHRIKLIDFGSACFEGKAAHTYIQSRFYRSPEVLIGIDYDGAIDMWSLGCVAAELFLGLPILPGQNEHDQLGRICEMIGNVPEWMLEQGKKSSKYFVRDETQPTKEALNIIQSNKLLRSSWRIKSREEFIASLSEEEKKRLGGKSKLQQQPPNRYFKKKLLSDIVMHNVVCSSAAERETLLIFVHFLKGILNPDPCERWTAFQASSHPFITGVTFRRRNGNDLNTSIGKGKMQITDEIYWSLPWDPTVCRRILSLKRNKRSEPSNLHKSLDSHKEESHINHQDDRSSRLLSPTSRVTNMASALSLSLDQNQHVTPPLDPNRSQVLYPQIYQTPTSTSYSAHSTQLSQWQSTHQRQVPTSLSLSLHAPLNLRLDPPPDTYVQSTQQGQIPTSLSISLHAPLNLRLDPPPDAHVLPNHLMVPTMSYIGAQSYSGSIQRGSMPHGARGDLGYALLRPGVVPTGPGGGQINQLPIMNPLHLQHNITNTTYQYPTYMTSHFVGPSSPQTYNTHQVNMPQDTYTSYEYPYGSSQMHRPQTFQYNANLEDTEGHGFNNNESSYRGRSM